MSKLTKILISATTSIIALGSFATIAFAATVVSFVTFTPNPLFVQGNFLPADEATGVVEVRNSGTSPQIVITEAVHVSDPDNLSSQLHLLITKTSGGTALYDGSFKTFLTGGEKVLSGLPGSSNETYTFVVTFNDINDNLYQGKTLDFNLCVGFQGGQTRCGDTVVGDGEDTGGGDNSDGGGTILGSGGSSSGGGSSTRHLVISNEQAININADGTIPGSGTATITWDTNLLSTSQVVYGPASGSYTLNLIPPNFGYPASTTEETTKVMHHSMFLTGLTPGAIYKYRVVSRASPPTISYEHQFTVPISGFGSTELGAESAPLGISNGEGSVLGASSENSEAVSGSGEIDLKNREVPEVFNGNNLASAFSSGWSGLISKCSLIALLILLVIYLIWRFALRPRYERKGLPEEKIKQKFYAFFGLSSALAIVVAFLLDQTCPIPIFLIALLLSLGLFSYYRYFR